MRYSKIHYPKEQQCITHKKGVQENNAPMLFSWIFDGPLFPDRTIRYHPDQRKPYPGNTIDYEVSYWRMDEISRHFWTHLNNVFDFKTVVSSSWRTFFNKPEVMVDLFVNANEIPLVLHDDWRTKKFDSRYDCQRAAEIHEWLTRHPEIKNFIIIDDEGSGQSLLSTEKRWKYGSEMPPVHEYMNPATIIVSEDSGFSSYDINKIVTIMKGWK